ncbi:MAG TPA: Crp/Fnr family transcriptional regulator [Stellaceae bacterium]|jgi:CRP-like cAMP-binding protein|nr:Crp/Fnr family transcriptional regulator [Stellaceae bacterium]
MQPPIHAPRTAEALLTGGRLLRRAFMEAPGFSAARGTVIVAANDPDPPILMIHRGTAYRSITVPDGRRAIVDFFLPTNFVGLDRVVTGPSEQEIIAASGLSYRALSAATLRDLIRNDSVALSVFALLAEQRRRVDQHILTLARFDARERICGFVLGVYERLRRSELISRPTFNLPLNQDQMADHLGMTMVHVSRTLRRLREEQLLLVDRQVAIVLDVEGVREVATGSRHGRAHELAEISEAGACPANASAFASDLRRRSARQRVRSG